MLGKCVWIEITEHLNDVANVEQEYYLHSTRNEFEISFVIEASIDIGHHHLKVHFKSINITHRKVCNVEYSPLLERL